MSARTADRLVNDYLVRLDRAAAALPPDRRAELLDEIGDHIATSREQAGDDEVAVRALLDRLGSPEEIAVAAGEDQPVRPALAPPRPTLALEYAAVSMLTVGSLLLVIGWLVGVLLLWVSARWTLREKVLGTLVVPFGPGTALMLGSGVGFGRTCLEGEVRRFALPEPGTPLELDEPTCSGFALPPGVGIAVFVLLLVAPFVVGVVLLRRARARAGLS